MAGNFYIPDSESLIRCCLVMPIEILPRRTTCTTRSYGSYGILDSRHPEQALDEHNKYNNNKKKKNTTSKMNQANVTKLVSKLNYNYQPKHRRLKNVDGPQGRIRKIQKTLTALFKYERLELFYNRGDEVRGYADRLISEAIRHGPNNPEMMDLADFWILEKQYVHKLFKVFVPRYQDYSTSYTKLHKIPRDYPGIHYKKAVLELRGNIFPELNQTNPHQDDLIHNLLLNEARKEFRLEKYKELAESLNTKEPDVSDQ